MNSYIIKKFNDFYKSTIFNLLTILILYSINSPLNAAILTLNNGLETGDLTGLKCSGNCPKIATNPIANGKYSGNFYLDRSMPTTYRTEVDIEGSARFFEFGQEYWLSLDYFYKDWVKDKNGEVAPIQVHQRPGSWDKACYIGSAVAVAPFLMVSSNDEVKFKTYGGNTLWQGLIEKGKWLNITVHFIMSKGNDGFIEAWKDGVKLGRVTGANVPKTDACGNDMKTPYFKMGIYKWGWKKADLVTDSSRRQLFIDNFKLAKGSDGYSLVNSKSTTTSTSTSTTSTESTSVQDTTAPALSNIQAEVTDTTATITWETNEAANSIAKYGFSNLYGTRIEDNLLVTSHSVTLDNLEANKQYHYRVISKDSSDNYGGSVDLTFTTNAAVTKDIVAHWPMTDVTGTAITDVSGNEHSGALINGALLTNGGGVKFDGVNDYINAGNFDVTGNAMTLSAWVWSDDLANCVANDCRIISKATGTGEQDHYFMVSTIKVDGVTRLRFRLKTEGVTSTLISNSSNVLNNTWVHVTAVYDGTAMRLYQDGVEVGSIAKQGSITANSNSPVWIGSNPPNASSRPWKGHIYDVQIHNYALTKEEISSLAYDSVSPAIDDVAPVISHVQAEVTDTTATIHWETNEAANSIAKYGLSDLYGTRIEDNLLVTSHSLTLDNLEAGKQYHYRLIAKDSSDNYGGSVDMTFTTTIPVIEDVVAHWPMTVGTGTTVTDFSGNGHTGTLVNGALLTNGGGVKFDGVNDYINTGKFDVTGNAMTLSAWVWADDLANCVANDCRIISKATGTGEQDHYFMVSTIKVNGVTRLRFRLKTQGVTSTLIAASGKVLNNTWVHVAAVYDGTTMRLYQDGVEVGSMAKQGSITANSNSSVWIGSNPPNASSRPWKGQIDEVRIYNQALTYEEISQLARQ